MLLLSSINTATKHLIYFDCNGASSSPVFLLHIWDLLRENLSLRVFEQHRRRSACAFAQSDQRLCYWLLGKYHM